MAQFIGRRGGSPGSLTRNPESARERPGTYLTIVEFESYDSAMENSNRPETSDFAAKMAALCDGPPVFRNLDVMWEDNPEAADNA